MSNAVWPSLIHGLTFTSMKSPEFKTLVQSAPNGYTVRISQYANPIWHWNNIWDYIYDNYNSPQNTMPYTPYTDLRTFMGFLMARFGQQDDFLYTDPDDHSVGPGTILGVPNSQAQLQLITDGAGNYYSPVQRNMGGLFYEDITDLNGGITVYANGTLTTNYDLLGPGFSLPGYSFLGLYLKWHSIPAVPVTATFNFYFRVRFDMDQIDFEKFMGNLWTIGGSSGARGAGEVKFITARPPTP